MVGKMDKRLLSIVRKELKRVFTDRRLVMTVLILPGLSIALIYSVMGMVTGDMNSQRDLHTYRLVVHEAPESFSDHLEGRCEGRFLLTEKEDSGDALEASLEALRAETVDGVLVFDEGFEKRLEDFKRAGSNPNVNVYYNPVSDYSGDAYRWLTTEILPEYREAILGERLGNPAHARVFTVNQDNLNPSVASEAKISSMILGSLMPIFISIFLFAGAMNIGIDMLAGEKERGTLATVLLTPVKRETVALGKMISLAIVAMGSTLSSLTGILVTLPLSSSLFGGIDMANISVSLEQWLFLGAALVLLAGVYVTLILSLSMIAGSVKEAGAYVTPVYMVVLVSGMMAATGFGGDHLRNYLIPVFGNVLVLRDIFVDEVTWSGFLTNSGISLLVILILLLAFRRIFKMERYLYGG